MIHTPTTYYRVFPLDNRGRPRLTEEERKDMTQYYKINKGFVPITVIGEEKIYFL